MFDSELFGDELGKLKTHPLDRFKGKRLKVKEIFYNDQILHKNFTEQNYKEALRELEQEGKITVEYTRSRKLAGEKLTMPDEAEIIFL